MLCSIAVPAKAAASSIRLRASTSFGLSQTWAKLATLILKASCEYISESAFLFLVTAVSTACVIVSMPVQAVTRGGCDSVSRGSRMASFAAALGSPQAILACVFLSAIKEDDLDLLPGPAGVGIATTGGPG